MARLRIIVVLAFALVLATGCSTLRFGYGQAPELVYWWLDGYADFDDFQSPKVRRAIGDWFAWHRRTQLPDYAGLLASAQRDVLADTTPAAVCAWWGAVRERGERALAQTLPLAAGLAGELSAAQLAHIEHQYTKKNEDFRAEYLDADPARRLEEAVERAIERAETMYGELDEVQRARVARLVAASPFDPEAWLAERRQRQRDALLILRRIEQERPGRDAALAALRAWSERLQRSPREPYRRYAQTLEQYNCAFAAALHNSTSAAQRQAAAEKLKGWEADLRALAADAN